MRFWGTWASGEEAHQEPGLEAGGSLLSGLQQDCSDGAGGCGQSLHLAVTPSNPGPITKDSQVGPLPHEATLNGATGVVGHEYIDLGQACLGPSLGHSPVLHWACPQRLDMTLKERDGWEPCSHT